MTLTINERGGGRVSLPKGKGLEGEIRVMGWEKGSTEVEGSSAKYPVKAIKRDFAEAFPVGTRMRANHDGMCEAGGDIRRIIAKTTGVPVYKDHKEMGPGMYAPVIFAEQWSPFVTEFSDVVGVSISAAAELKAEEFPEDQERDDWGRPIDEDGNVILPTVERFLTAEEYPYNSIDVVEAPGADGRIVSVALESAKKLYEGFVIREAAHFVKDTRKTPRESAPETPAAAPPRATKEEIQMDDKELSEALVEAAREGARQALESVQAASTPSEQPTLGQMSEAVATAGLTKEGREAVYERVERGESLADAITKEQAREAAVLASRPAPAADPVPSQEDSTLGFGITFDEGDKSLTTKGAESGALSEADQAEFDFITSGKGK
jgi:hypothetical protein